MTNQHTTALIISSGLLMFGLGAAAQQAPDPSQSNVPELLQQFVPVTDEILLRPKPENWITFRNGYDLWGYSSLSQVDVGNVTILAQRPKSF